MPKPRTERVLVLSPHPDDMALGCGGTVKKISTTGAQVDAVYLTNGEHGVAVGEIVTPEIAGTLAQQRRQEALEECRILGVRSVTFLNGNDGCLDQQTALGVDLLKLLQDNDYRSVFCPWREDIHPDHAATFELFKGALQKTSQDIQTWLYEVWNPLKPNTVVAIDDTFECKIEAIKAHASQLACKNYLEGFIGLAQYRGLLGHPARYAEAFFVCERSELLAK